MSENNAVTLGVVLASWKANDRKLAMEQFGALDWQNPNVLKGLPGEELSESDFMALSPDEQSRIQAEVWPALKEIAKGAIAAGEEAERQGRKEDSTRYYEATVQLGDHLSDSKHSLLFQEFGKAIKNFAMNKLNC